MKRIYSAVFVFCLAIFLLFISVPLATAKEAGPSYIGVFGGYVKPDSLENSRDVSVDNSWSIGAKAGYIFPQVGWLAAELEYFYMAKQDVDEAGFGGDFSAQNVMANLLVRYPEGKIHPYAGVGVGWSWATIKVGSVDESDNGFAWQILAGLNFEMTPRWSADLAYRYFQCKYNDVGSPGEDVTSKNHMILIGVNYHF